MSNLPDKVTKDHLDHIVAQSQTTFTNPVGTLTHCVITLPCEFTVTGESACVDPANYNKELGEKYALENAVEKLWELEGYLLANDRFRAKHYANYLTRMIFEAAELRDKLDNLNALLEKPQPDFVNDKQWRLLQEQQKHMSAYLAVLRERIEDASEEEGVNDDKA